MAIPADSCLISPIGPDFVSNKAAGSAWSVCLAAAGRQGRTVVVERPGVAYLCRSEHLFGLSRGRPARCLLAGCGCLLAAAGCLLTLAGGVSNKGFAAVSGVVNKDCPVPASVSNKPSVVGGGARQTCGSSSKHAVQRPERNYAP